MSQDLKFLTLNRALNPNSQFSVGNWVAFADAAATSPVDGTGGSPSVTITRTLSSPLEGVASFLFTKDAANRQGEGISSDIVLQPSDATKVFTFNADYQITTGTYSEGTPSTQSDFTWWVYDVTNAVMYQAIPSNLQGAVSTTNQYSSQWQWQVPVGCLTARVIGFIPTTSASAFTIKLNNIQFGRIPRNQGEVETPWQSYTPIFGSGFGTVTAISFQWKRVGQNMIIRGFFTAGTTTTGAGVISIPSGFAIDSNFLNASNEKYQFGYYTTALAAGAAVMSNTNYTIGGIWNSFSSTTNVQLDARTTTNVGGINDNVSTYLNSGDVVIIPNCVIPIQGWGTNATVGQDTDTRVVAAKYVMGASYSLASGAPFQFNTLNYDTHGAATYGTGVTFTYFAPVFGYYRFLLGLKSSNTGSFNAGQTVSDVRALINGTSFVGNFMGLDVVDANVTRAPNYLHSGAAKLNAGEALIFNFTSSGTFNFGPDTTTNYVEIERMSGPAQIQASDVPSSSYNTNAGQSINNATTAIIDFEDKIWDTFGSVTTGASWKFTAQRAGKLQIDSTIAYASAVFTAGTNIQLFVYKNGSVYKKIGETLIQAAVSITDIIVLGGGCMVDVNAGDFVDIRTAHGEITARSLTTTASENYCDISYKDAL